MQQIHASHALSFNLNTTFCLDSCVSIFDCIENEIRDDLLFTEFDNIVVIILSGRVLYAVQNWFNLYIGQHQ